MTTLRMHSLDVGIGEELQPVDLLIRSVMKREQPLGAATLEVCVVSDQRQLLTVESFPGGEWAVTWPSLMSVDLDPTLAHASITREPGVDAEYEAILLSPLVGAVAMLRGSLVLHASAVEIDGVATLLVGHSGSGKTSVTAMLCAAGARLISEDVCVLASTSGGQPIVHSGTTEIRVRQNNESLVGLFDRYPQRISVDGRCVVTTEQTTADEVVVRRIALVSLDRSTDTASIQPIEPSVAVAALMQVLRFPPEQRSALLLQNFDRVAALAGQVEMVDLRVPWGSPVTAAACARLMSVLV